MLVAFNVTNLAKWGYDESTVFIDPMEPAFRPKAIVPEDFTDEAIWAKLDWFWSLNAYNRTATGVIGKRRSRRSPGTGRLGIEPPSRLHYP
jgi:bilirubin oxidase